ncbi:pyridoxamine 5'-phosphate oxidase family protein [Paludibacterium sp.]|uniref:HugZ family pyridoxamine 5'-phosphate oxidase n=1 Tax=Paludibacterium sp. TaxID=1917523 RepID=UPI0025E20137|nr:pyridoxamine 5'-phosphate oxidase family protein [Paludibacterium sp.]
MRMPTEPIIFLLHDNPSAALATHSQALPGYPFASTLPFVPDSAHCPVFLISGLAEHTRNLRADARASLLLQPADTAEPEASPRLTLLGDVTACAADPALVARYLRYQPGAERYLALGDFAFYRLQPRRLRMVAGFGQMGWVEAQDWAELAVLSPDDEAALLARVKPGHEVLGIDCYGIDWRRDGRRQRLAFEHALDAGAIAERLSAQGVID